MTSFPCYWPLGLPPQFVQCVRSFAEAHMRRQLHLSVFNIEMPIAPPCVCSDWYVSSVLITESEPLQKRQRVVGSVAPQLSTTEAGTPQQMQPRPPQLAAWARVRVGTTGFVSKILERLFTRTELDGRKSEKLVRFTLRRTFSECMCSRAFPTMRARPCAADSALIAVRMLVSIVVMLFLLIRIHLQQVAKVFLRDRANDGLSHCIRDASWDGDLYSIAANLDSGELADGSARQQFG
jgi:hypothetical protein